MGNVQIEIGSPYSQIMPPFGTSHCQILISSLSFELIYILMFMLEGMRHGIALYMLFPSHKYDKYENVRCAYETFNSR